MMDIFVMKTSTCFKGSYSLIVSHFRSVSNYFESKSDIYFLLITVRSMYQDKTILVGEHCSHVMINMTLEHKHHND